ncbi:MAG TPA: HYR domain-containing protein [Planctomycetota bacterium]|nr:HYR domain-containing protein [Planctomycetota bacterium]
MRVWIALVLLSGSLAWGKESLTLTAVSDGPDPFSPPIANVVTIAGEFTYVGTKADTKTATNVVRLTVVIKNAQGDTVATLQAEDSPGKTRKPAGKTLTVKWSGAADGLYSYIATGELVHKRSQRKKIVEKVTRVSQSLSGTILVDGTPPLIDLPATIVAEATSSAGAPVDFPVPSASDNFTPADQIAVSISHAPGSQFPLGTTPVSVTATDLPGNSTTQTFNIEVVDSTAPVINPPADFSVSSPSGGGVSVVYPPATVSDAVTSEAQIVVSYNPPSGSVLPVGSNVVTVFATDAAGNTSQATFTVTVVSSSGQDTEAPILTIPQNIIAEADGPGGAAVDFVALVSDNETDNPQVTYSHAPRSLFPLGLTTVSIRASDAVGNYSEGTFTVTVVDTTPPDLSTATSFVVQATSPNGAEVTYDPAEASDAVTTSPSVTYSNNSGTMFPEGDTVVQVEATDSAGNKKSRSFTVTVLKDLAPTVRLDWPVENAVYRGDVTFRGVVVNDDGYDKVTVKILIDGAVKTTIAPNSDGSFVTSVAVDAGNPSVSAIAEEDAGNVEATPRKIWVDKRAPSSLEVKNPNDLTQTINWAFYASSGLPNTYTSPGWFNGLLFENGQTPIGVTNLVELGADQNEIPPGFVLPASSGPATWYAPYKFSVPSGTILSGITTAVFQTETYLQYKGRDAADNPVSDTSANQVFWTPIILEPNTYSNPRRIAIQKGDSLLIGTSSSGMVRLSIAEGSATPDGIQGSMRASAPFDVACLKWEDKYDGGKVHLRNVDEFPGQDPIAAASVTAFEVKLDVYSVAGHQLSEDDKKDRGLYVGVDTGDDDKDTISNREDTNIKSDNPYLAKLVIRHPDPSKKRGVVRLNVQAPNSSSNLANARLFWDSSSTGTPGAGTELSLYDGSSFSVSQIDASGRAFYLQGTSASAVDRDITVVLEYDPQSDFQITKTMRDAVRVSVVQPDISLPELLESKEVAEPGRPLQLNDNYDEADDPEAPSAQKDHQDNDMKRVTDGAVIVDDELLEFTRFWLAPTQNGRVFENCQIRLEQSGTGKVRVFAINGTGAGKESDQLLDAGSDSGIDLVEYLKPGGGKQDFKRFFVEGCVTGKLALSLVYLRDGYPVIKDVISLSVLQLDADVDSDNTTVRADYPDAGSKDREAVEDRAEKTEPVRTPVNWYDRDFDDVPGFADGITGFDSSPDPDMKFESLIMDLACPDFPDAEITFVYSASDPAAISVDSSLPVKKYEPAGGYMRIWRKDASSQRNPAAINSGGDFVAPDKKYKLSDFGLPPSGGTVQLYMEVPKRGADKKKVEVKLEVKTDRTFTFKEEFFVEDYELDVPNPN